MNISIRRQKIRSILDQRLLLENKLLGARPPFIAASLVMYRNICGKPGCACKAGHTHGPYAYLSFKENGKTRLKVVRQEHRVETAAAVERYRDFQRALRQIRRLNRQTEVLFKALRAGLVRRVK